MASPIDHLTWPIRTPKVGSVGTHNALRPAKAKGARFLMASTSEVYGDPQVDPQPESYRGHADPIGGPGVYDKAKRFSEAPAFAYHRSHALEIRVPRIVNAYGPRIRMDDGPAVPTLIRQALADEPLTVHGDGGQTRWLSFVDDLSKGFIALLCSSSVGPVNIGSDDELTMAELARTIIEVTDWRSTIEFVPRPLDDPQVRRPQTDLARELLGWTVSMSPGEGIGRIVARYRDQLVA